MQFPEFIELSEYYTHRINPGTLYINSFGELYLRTGEFVFQHLNRNSEGNYQAPKRHFVGEGYTGNFKITSRLLENAYAYLLVQL